MITRVIKIDGDNHGFHQNGDIYKMADYFGKSTDTKPTEGVNNAECFYEMDTKKIFMFDKDTTTWLEQ